MKTLRRLRLYLGLLVLPLLGIAPPASAHENHGGEKPAISAGTGMIARTSRVGDYEVLLKHPAIEPLHNHAARVFITRYQTNEPIKDGAVRLAIAGKGVAPINVTVKPTERAGEYEVTFPPLDQGAYQLSAEVAVGETSGRADYGMLAVAEPKTLAAAENENRYSSWSTWLWLLGVAGSALLGVKGFFAWRRRALLLPEV